MHWACEITALTLSSASVELPHFVRPRMAAVTFMVAVVQCIDGSANCGITAAPCC